MPKRRSKTQIITDKKSLDNLIWLMQKTNLILEEQIVNKRIAIIMNEERIHNIRKEGKYVQVIESNIK